VRRERHARLVGQRGAFIVPFDRAALDNAPLFDVPENMSKVFKADALAAELAVTFKVKVKRKDKEGKEIEVEVDRIDTRDSAGRVIDVHCLRHTFGTLLAKSGASLQVAQKAMRHSTPTLTANVYTHLGLMDIAGAVNAMPEIKPVVLEPPMVAEQGADLVAPDVAPLDRIWVQQTASNCNMGERGGGETETEENPVSGLIRVDFQQSALERDGGRRGTRTPDILRVRQAL